MRKVESDRYVLVFDGFEYLKEDNQNLSLNDIGKILTYLYNSPAYIEPIAERERQLFIIFGETVGANTADEIMAEIDYKALYSDIKKTKLQNMVSFFKEKKNKWLKRD